MQVIDKRERKNGKRAYSANYHQAKRLKRDYSALSNLQLFIVPRTVNICIIRFRAV